LAFLHRDKSFCKSVSSARRNRISRASANTNTVMAIEAQIRTGSFIGNGSLELKVKVKTKTASSGSWEFMTNDAPFASTKRQKSPEDHAEIGVVKANDCFQLI
jgi:hypothetical protein